LARTFARKIVSMKKPGLRGVTSTIMGIKGLIVSAGGTGSDNGRVLLVTELQGLKEQLLN
jgi:flagellar hook-associated protein 3 FlgL